MLNLFNKELNQKLVNHRRDFHKYAEVKWTEFRTASIVAEKLIKLGYVVMLGNEISVKGVQVSYPPQEIIIKQQQRAIEQGANSKLVHKMHGLPGVVGILDTCKPGPAIAMRFDMDALETQEKSELGHYPYDNNFSSVNDGFCHACGHDAHTAIGLGVAEILMSIKDTLSGKIKLIFQPAEEGGGGAIGIVKRGVLDDVEYFFAPHIGLIKPDGLPLLSHGIICGINDFLDIRRIDVTYEGKAAHSCGDPHSGKNALLAACNATINIHAIAPHSEGTLRVNVGMLSGGVSRNTIAPNASLVIEARGENKVVTDYGEGRIKAILNSAAEMYGVKANIKMIGSTRSAKSDKEARNIVQEVAQSIDWFTEYYDLGSVGGSDDASEMIAKVQSNGGIATYIGIGADIAGGVHSEAYDFDENVLLPAVELFIKIIQRLQMINLQ